MINLIPSGLNGAKAVSRPESSQQPAQMSDSAEPGSSFHSLLHTATHSAAASESGAPSKPENKPERKKASDDVAAGRQDQNSVSAGTVTPVQQDIPVPSMERVRAVLSIDVTMPVASSDASIGEGIRMPLPGAADASRPNLAANQAPSHTDAGQPVEVANGGAEAAAVLIAGPAEAQAGASAISQASNGISIPAKSAGSIGPEHMSPKAAESAEELVSAAGASQITSPQLGADAALQFRMPKLQSVEPIPGVASGSKLKRDGVSSPALSVARSAAPANGATPLVKGKDQHSQPGGGQDDNANSTGQQAALATPSANPAHAQIGAAHAGADGFQTAIAAASSRNTNDSVNSRPLKADVPQATAPSAPAAVAVGQAQDLQAKVSAARLVQSVHDSELRVGMRSGEFGDIAIHTSLSRSAISAQISVEHGELAKVIAASLPDLRSVLGNRDHLEIRVAMHDQVSSQMDFSGRGAGQGSQRESRSTANPLSFSDEDGAVAVTAASVVNQMEAARSALPGRVDVRI